MPFDPHRDRVILAVGDPLLRTWIDHVARCAGLTAAIAITRADLFERLADPTGQALLLGDCFDGAPAEHLLAAIRTAGSAVPAFVLAPWRRPALIARLRTLAPLTVLADPFDGAAVTAALRGALAAPRLRALG
jgi:hypothetical protein